MRGGQVTSPPLAVVAALAYLLSASLAFLGQAPDPGVEGQAGMGPEVPNLQGEHPGAGTV